MESVTFNYNSLLSVRIPDPFRDRAGEGGGGPCLYRIANYRQCTCAFIACGDCVAFCGIVMGWWPQYLANGNIMDCVSGLDTVTVHRF